MTAADRFLFLLGGARSGKSRFAVELASADGSPVTIVVTADPAGDPDLTARVDRHRGDRPADWQVIEAPVELGAAVDRVDGPLIVDCLTIWTANLMASGLDPDEIVAAADDLAGRLAARRSSTIVVSNEVGLGVHPTTPLGRDYRDVLGWVNQAIATQADRSLLFVAGRAVELGDPWVLLGLDRPGTASTD